LKFAAKLQYESAILWHSRKEKEIFHKRVIFSSNGFEDKSTNQNILQTVEEEQAASVDQFL
jgi:hypothetical protein